MACWLCRSGTTTDRGIRPGEKLQGSIDRGGAPFELDLPAGGQEGGWDASFLVGYREGHACPACGTPVKIETGSTSGYICPRCQPLASSG